MEFQMCVPSLFGLEGLVADELKRLNMKDVRAENGRVLFTGEKPDIARANINIATGERILLVVGETRAETFDMLFEGVKAMPWEHFIPMDGAFPVKGHALDSKLHSIPDCQSIIKKAIVERLKAKYKVEWLKETGAKYQVQFAIMKDVAALYIDTSGSGLHKRGYRPVGNAAPLRETLAAAIVRLARYRGREELCDPFCGSGTLPIEAALAALNRAPGLNRAFAAQSFKWLDNAVWAQAKDEARDREYHGSYNIWGGDIDPDSVKIAGENAHRAGVREHIRFEVAEAAEFKRAAPGGIIVTNPPYGERVMEHQEAERIYKKFGAAVRVLDGWKLYILSSHTEFERAFGKTAVKKRKLYNGMIKCDLFMYY
ncbi:THUMP domain-containing class I SAM-dependent RNA methyltransferase [Sporobacter termitidis]|nr:class I SAM-dependent RNA methyltransferase [Sporobacter termitidis]